MKKIFISGSISIKSLDENIKLRLNNIIKNNHTVLIGDANGTDLIIQSYFKNMNYSRINVYCSGYKCRNNIGNWQTHNVEVSSRVKGRKFYMVKDKQMALDSDYGFMIWDGKSAGTINNLINLTINNKIGVIYIQDKQEFKTITNISELEGFISECKPGTIELIDKKIFLRKKIEQFKTPVQEELAFTAVSELKENDYR